MAFKLPVTVTVMIIAASTAAARPGGAAAVLCMSKVDSSAESIGMARATASLTGLRGGRAALTRSIASESRLGCELS